MKITKEKLKQIIKEELELAEQEENPEQSVKTRAEFAKKLKELSLEIPRVSSLTTTELQLINGIFSSILQVAIDGNAPSILKIIDNFTDKKIK